MSPGCLGRCAWPIGVRARTSLRPMHWSRCVTVKTKSRALAGSWQEKQPLSAASSAGSPSKNCANPQPSVEAYFRAPHLTLASRSRGAGAGRSERLPVPAHPRARDNAERVFITQPSCRPASGDGGLRAWASRLAPPVHAKSAIVRLGRAGRSPSSYTATRGVGSASHGAAHPPKTGLYNCRQYGRYVDSRFAQRGNLPMNTVIRLRPSQSEKPTVRGGRAGT